MLRRLVASPRRLVIVLLLADAAWGVAMVAAPATLAPGTVAGLDGRENHLDHAGLWASLPLPHALVYAVGDVLCHQKDWRSLHANGNALPVDERMTSIFAAALLGLALGLRAAPSPFVTDALRGALPRGLDARVPAARARAALLLGGLVALALLPAAVDVLWENLAGRESTRPIRFATGALAGVAGGLVLAAFASAVDAFVRLAWARIAPRRFPRLHRALGPLVLGRPAAERETADPAPLARGRHH